MSDDRIWKALADSTRREILDLLRVRARTTGELAEQFEMSRYGVMKHLAVLVEANLVLVRRRGRQRWNHLNAVPLQEAIERWAGPYQRAVAGSLLRLRDVAESFGRESEMNEQVTEQPGTVARSFQIEQEIRVSASPQRVYDVMTARTDEWWDRGFRKVEGSTIALEPELGGRMYEHNGQHQVMWATVTGIEPGRFLELTGRIGMDSAALAVVSFVLDSDGEQGTVIRLSHHATGEVDDEARSNYNGGWEYLLGTCLKELAEAS